MTELVASAVTWVGGAPGVLLLAVVLVALVLLGPLEYPYRRLVDLLLAARGVHPDTPRRPRHRGS